MADRPILFNAPMVRAILSGAKTQTRLVVKPQPPADQSFLGWIIESTVSREEGCAKWGAGDFPYINRSVTRRCPYDLGDRLWVREAWAKTQPLGLPWPQTMIVYREGDNRTDYGGPWRPSIHMPRAASRITLEVTGVRVERLQQIDEADARAEGISRTECPDWHATTDYRALWEQINGPGSWDANPWVWVIEFRKVAP